MNEVHSQLSALTSSELNPSLTLNRNHNEFILDLLIKAARKEQTTLSRSMALNALAIYLYQQLSLSKDNLDNQFLTIINILIGCTKVSQRFLKPFIIKKTDRFHFLNLVFQSYIIEKCL